MSRPIERSAFQSSNAEATTDYIRRMYIDNETSFHGVQPASTFTARLAGVGDLRADRVAGDLDLHLRGDPLGYALFGQLHEGTWNVGPRDRQVLFGPGDALLYPMNAAFTLEAHRFNIAVASLPLSRLATMAAGHDDIDPTDLRFSAMTAVSPPMARHFTATVALVHHELHDAQLTATHPLIAEELSQLMAAAVLSAFPNTFITATRSPGRDDVAAAAVRRAADFMDTHADQPVTVAEIASAVGTRAGALRQAFLRHRGLSPMAYLRRVRLSCAHRELQAADPSGGESVAAVAARWGFRRTADFAAAYRDAYGVTPDHTLHS